MCSMIGRPATGTRGFGMLLVSGRRREPSPPAITTAFIPASSQIGSYARARRTQEIRLRPALDVATADREPFSHAGPRPVGIDPRQPGAAAVAAGRRRSRQGAGAGG